MKRLMVSLFLSIFILSGMNVIAADKKVPKPLKFEKKIIAIPGNTAWQNTGIRLRPKDRVTITATGTICFNTDDSETCIGPNGYQGEHGIYSGAWPNDYLQCDDPLKSVNHASLIADIGSETVFVGNSKTFQGKEGFLYLGINDCSLTGQCGNSGEFRVVIQVKR